MTAPTSRPSLSDIPALQSPRLTLRAPRIGDFEAFAAFMASHRSAMAGGRLDRADAWRSFGHIVGHWPLRGFGSFAIVPRSADGGSKADGDGDGDGAAIGCVGPWFPEGWPERELGWSLWDGAAEGRGYVAEAMGAVFPFVWNTLGWDTAVSYVHPGNAASIRTAERLGAMRDTVAATAHPEDLVYRHHPGAAESVR